MRAVEGFDAAQELAGDLLVHRVNPQSFAEAAQQELITSAPLLQRIPRQLDRITTQLQRGDCACRPSYVPTLTTRNSSAGLVGQSALVLVAATSGALGVGLLGPSSGPMVTSGLSMYHAFGCAALTLSFVLLLRVLTAVLREDR